MEKNFAGNRIPFPAGPIGRFRNTEFPRIQHSDSGQTESTDNNSPALARYMKHICENIDERITLDDLSKVTGDDKFRIIRLFRTCIGMTPHAYIIHLRVARAAELLRSGEPAAEVASEVGFVDQSHLIRNFKRHFGITPKRYVEALA